MKKMTVFAILSMFAFYSQANSEYNNVQIVTEHLAPFQIGENNKLIGGNVAVQL